MDEGMISLPSICREPRARGQYRGWRRSVVLSLLACLLFVLFHHFCIKKAVVSFVAETESRTTFKVYWPTPEGTYSEINMNRVTLQPGEHTYRMRINDITRFDHLRLDTSEPRPARVTIKQIQLSQKGVPSLNLAAKDLAQVQVLANVEQLILDDKGLTVFPIGADPQLILRLPRVEKNSTLLLEMAAALLIVLTVLAVAWATAGLLEDEGFVPYLLFFVLALILTMAVLSKNNQHPDEFVHVHAAEYYQDNLKPPRVGDPDIRNTYSPYGVSRLHSGEVVYLLAGKFLRVMRVFTDSPYLLLRLFNVFVFAVLLLFSLKRPAFRCFLLPLLVSPQIWYIFSYFNSEAFALTISLLAGYQLAAPESLLSRLRRNEEGCQWPSVLLLGLLAGLLLLVKKNFYFFVLFLFLYFIWQLLFEYPRPAAVVWKRLVAIVLVGGVLAASSMAVDQWVNGFKKNELQLQAQENFSQQMYKPSTPLEKKHPYLQMRDRGISLSHMLQVYRWGEKSFQSAFGVYGYTTISASLIYYNFVRITALLLLAGVIFSITVRGHLPAQVLLWMTLVLGMGLIVVAMHRSWTTDFQAQGRYFLPIVPMLSVLWYRTRSCMLRSTLYPLLLTLFILSVYNFLGVGLYEIAKFGCTL